MYTCSCRGAGIALVEPRHVGVGKGNLELFVKCALLVGVGSRPICITSSDK